MSSQSVSVRTGPEVLYVARLLSVWTFKKKETVDVKVCQQMVEGRKLLQLVTVAVCVCVAVLLLCVWYFLLLFCINWVRLIKAGAACRRCLITVISRVSL